MKLLASIRLKLLLIFLTFGFIPVVIGEISLYLLLGNYWTNRTYEQLTTLKNIKSKQLEAFITDRIRETEFIAQSAELLKMLKNDKLFSSQNFTSTSEISNNEIAKKLFISVRPVETHKSKILHKLQLKSTVELVKFAIINKIIEL